MRAFWWFERERIAGMARPGFNHFGWFDVPFVEAAALSWVGQKTSGRFPVGELHAHVSVYAPKLASSYDMTPAEAVARVKPLMTANGLHQSLQRLNDAVGILHDFSCDEGTVTLEFETRALDKEITFLNTHGLVHVVSLTEQAFDHDLLGEHFQTYHVPIDDLGIPSHQQVHRVAAVLEHAGKKGEGVAVHCLAGIGRTSTMLIAAKMVHGGSLDELLQTAQRQNPAFMLGAEQLEFLRTFAP